MLSGRQNFGVPSLACVVPCNSGHGWISSEVMWNHVASYRKPAPLSERERGIWSLVLVQLTVIWCGTGEK